MVGNAAWAAAGFVVLYLTCEQYALMFAPFALVAGMLALAQHRFRARAAMRLVAMGMAVGLIVLIVARPTLTLHHKLGFSRSASLVQLLSAQLGDFFTRPGDAWMTFPPPSPYDTAGLFPGIVLLSLAVVGVAIGWLSGTATPRPWIAYFVGSVIAAMLLAQGLNLNLIGWQPFAMLRVYVPGFNELRSVFRFAIIMQIALLILATMALASIHRYARRTGSSIIIVLTLFAALDNLTLPAPLIRM